jgi:leader peptidase (prepilin peptidase) / N-methyltransferase
MELTKAEWVMGAVFCFITGACIGSYLNVFIYRWPRGMSTSNPRRSICFSCQSPIRWQDNLPIISWFLLGGKCRACGESFSIRYSLVELLTGLLFLHVFLSFGLTYATGLYLLWVALQVAGSFIDIDTCLLPDRITLSGAVVFPLAVLILDIADQTEGLVVPNWEESFFGALFAAGFIYLIRFVGTIAFGREAMGLGDVKLMAMNGALLGWWRSLFVIMGLGPLLALVTVLILRLLSRFKIERHTEVPFGPFLCLASYISLYWADEIVEWWLSLPPGYSEGFDRPWRFFGW